MGGRRQAATSVASEIVGQDERDGLAVGLGDPDLRPDRLPGPARPLGRVEPRADWLAADLDQLVALLEAGLLGRAARRHVKDVQMIALQHEKHACPVLVEDGHAATGFQPEPVMPEVECHLEGPEQLNAGVGAPLVRPIGDGAEVRGDVLECVPADLDRRHGHALRFMKAADSAAERDGIGQLGERRNGLMIFLRQAQRAAIAEVERRLDRLLTVDGNWKEVERALALQLDLGRAGGAAKPIAGDSISSCFWKSSPTTLFTNSSRPRMTGIGRPTAFSIASRSMTATLTPFSFRLPTSTVTSCTSSAC